MTSNQRRPGFRLPWASESEATEAQPTEPTSESTAATADTTRSRTETGDSTGTPVEPANDATRVTIAPTQTTAAATPATAEVRVPEPTATTAAAPVDDSAAVPEPEVAAGFMRDLVAAMREVAEETRQNGLSDVRTKAEERVRALEGEADERREALKARAENDVAAVGEWARTETERIREEAEKRVIARRAQLDQELAAETSRAEAEAHAMRDRVAEYERQLDAYHAQLSAITDPAAFALAAKRLPTPPQLTEPTPAVPTPAVTPSRPVESPSAAEPRPAAVQTADPVAENTSTNGTTPAAEVHPAEEEVLASTVTAPGTASASADVAAGAAAEPTSTEILVKGLGSFGAITGFRQALASVDGVEGVSLSLGPTGEFVFRAIHATGFDVAGAITTLEGDAAKIEPHGDGGLRVTLERSR